MKNFLKRVLALALVLVMVSGYVPANVFAAEAAPALPTATVSKIRKADLTFALNFAADQITDEQLAYYGDWYADFELTVNKDVTFDANGGADGYLAGQYDGSWEDAWAGQWFYVPFNGPVNLEANESLRIMAFAAEALNEPGLKYTYKEVYEIVKDFNCGVFLEDAFLAANPDLEVKLELRMYNPKNETEAYTIGQTHIFTLADVDSAPALPTATATDLQKDELTFAMTFQADEITSEQLAFYGDWYADFELTVNKDVTLNANGGADGYLAGQYDGSWEDVWNGQWVNVPFDASVTLKANEPLKIMAFAAEKLGEPGLKYTYKEVYEVVKKFNCGAYFTPEFLVANPDLEVKLELKMYNEVDESESYVIGNTYIFKNEYVAYNVQTGKLYAKVSEATIAAVAGQTVRLLKNAEDMIVYVLDDITLDLDGHTLTTDYLFVTGDMVDDSEENRGLLKVSNHVMMQKDNRQLPVKTADGYKFFEILGFNAANTTPPNPDAVKYVFQPLFEAAAHEDLKAGQATTGVRVIVRVTWTRDDGIGAQDFVYNDEKVNTVLNSYNPATGKYGQMFTLELSNVSSYQGLTYQVYVVSDRSPEFTVGSQKVSVENQMTTEAVNLDNKAGATAVVPEGTKVDAGAKTLSLKVTNMAKSNSNIALQEGESQKSVDVHVDGIAADNTVPTLVTVEKLAAAGLNEGNLKLYHVENGATNLMTQVMTLAEVDEHNEFWYDVATGNVTMALATFSEIAAVENELNPWDGTIADSLTANAEGIYEIFNANQLAKFGAMVDAGQTFLGETVRLMMDVNLKGSNGGVYFNPIGYGYGYSGGKVFSGTFDGNGNTIRGLTQSGWDMEAKGMGDYTYSTAGGGLFASVKDATIKNLTMDGAYVVMECIDMGTVVGYAQGNCTFENIVVKNSVLANYQRYTGGAIGEVSNGHHILKNVDVDANTVVSSLWGDFDASLGGIIGGKWGHNNDDCVGENGHKVSVDMKNCDVAARLDAYNDVTSAYQWYSYRRCGMLIGHSEETTTLESGRTEATASYLTTDNCTVSYGDWINYHYCEFPTTTSLNARYPWVRVEENLRGFNGAYSNPRYGVPMFGEEKLDVENHTVDDGRHTNENQHHVLIALNQLYGGGQGCYGGNSHVNNGVTVLRGETLVTPATKFKSKVEKNYLLEIENGQSKTVTLGELFEESGNADVVDSGVYAFVSLVNKDDTVRGTYRTVDYSKDWTKNTLTFTGKGVAKITITDYYFCTPTTITINVGEVEQEPVEKFETKFTGDFLYRVGNANAVKLDSLFKAKDGAKIGTVAVTVETIYGASGTYTSNATWTDGEIKFNGTGVVKVIIKDEDQYCKPTELILEVVDATNATTATSATANNVVLLNNISGGFTVSGRYAVYGNGFTCTVTGDGRYLNNGLPHGHISVSGNGTLDNLRIISSIYPSAYLYFGKNSFGEAVEDGPVSKETASDGTVKKRYHYQLSAVSASGNATISNCYIYGGRNNIMINNGDVTVTDTVLECGTVANVQIQSKSDYTVTFNNVTTIQTRVNATVGDTSKVMLGAGILVGPETNDNPTIVLDGEFKQYNWVDADDKSAVSNTMAKSIIQGALDERDYNHTVNGKTASNLGIIYMNTYDAPITDNTGLPYKLSDISMKPEGFGGNTVNGQVYSVQGATADQIYANATENDKSTENGWYEPQFKYSANLGGQHVAEGNDEHCYRDGDTIYVMFLDGDMRELDLAALVNIAKYSGQDLDLQIACKDSNGNSVKLTDGKITLIAADTYTVTYTVTDTVFYDKGGNIINKEEVKYSWDVTVSVSLKDKAVPNAEFRFDSTKQKMGYAKKSGLANIGKSNFQYLPFLAGMEIVDYTPDAEPYTRFNGNDDFAKIAKVGTAFDEETNIATITVTLVDGGVITAVFSGIASAGSKTKTGSVLVRDNILYWVTDGDTGATHVSNGKDVVWKIISYSFVGNNGVTISDDDQVFSCNQSSGTVPTASFNITVKSTVTYDANGGSCGQTVGYATSESAAVTLPTPKRSGYMFVGWYTAGGENVDADGDGKYTPTANVTLYAQWGKPSTVTYDANGGSCGTDSETYTGTALTLPTPTRDGYWFTGWYDAAEGDNKVGDAGAAYNPKGDITLYAHWQEKVEYTVTYNANGGSVSPASATYQGTALTLPTPTREGHTFNGWFTAASGGDKITGATYTPSKNITLYAQWTINSYEISVTTSNATVKVNGAKVNSGSSVNIQYGTQVTVEVNYDKSNSRSTTIKGTDGTTYNSPFNMPAQNVTINATSKDSCVTGDTLVMLADGTQKRIDEVTYADQLLVWNFFSGAYDAVPAAIIFDHGEEVYEVLTLVFQDGTKVKTINGHGFFDNELNEFVFIDTDNVDAYIGHEFAKVCGDGVETVELVGYTVTDEFAGCYSIQSAVHINFITEGMFSETVPPFNGWFEYFEIGEGMKYDEAKMQADIEKYGLYDYSDFAEYVTYEQFVAFNGPYLKVLVGRGVLTYEQIFEMIATYVN